MWNLTKMTNWLYIIHYSTLKINHTVKLVKLFEKMFIWTPLFLITASRCCFHWSMLLLMKVYLRRQFETFDQLKRVLLIEWNELSDFHQQQHWWMEKRLEAVNKDNGVHIEHFFQIIWPIVFCLINFKSRIMCNQFVTFVTFHILQDKVATFWRCCGKYYNYILQ